MACPPSYFDELDQDLLADATSRFSMPLVLAGGAAGAGLALDPKIPPDVMIAAMVRGHAQGLASALSAVGKLCPADVARERTEQLLEAAIAEIRADLAAQPTTGATLQ